MRKSRFIVLFFLFGFIGGRSQMLAISDTDAAVEVDAVSDSASVVRDFSLSEAVVTGARYETDIRHLPMTVSVVGHRVLEESRESSILPVLNAYVPGFFSTSISVANNLSVDCDCDSSPEEPKMGDIGILASLDPVAFDKACTDLVRSSKDHGKIHLVERIDSRKGMHTLEYAEQLGMGSHMYGTIPIAASFAAKGVREDWLASFMMSSMLLNPQLILYSAALGRTMLTIRIVTCLLCGVSAGLLLHFCFRKKKFFRFEGMQEPENHDTDPRMPVRLLKNIWRNIKVTGPYFLVGIVLSALFQRYVPAESFASLFGEGNKGFGLLMAATLGVPMYVCGGGTIPLLMTWLNQGMSYGAATSFMLTGPATKITNLGAVKIVLGMRHFLYYLLFVMLYALLCGGVAELIVNEN